MMSMKEGVYLNMIKSMVDAYTGYVQIHSKGYWEEKNVDNSLTLNDTLIEALSGTPGITDFIPRIENFALAASDQVTKGVLVVGVDVEKEKRIRELDKRVVAGSYLLSDDKEVLIGSGLAKYLKIKEQDTIVLLGQGYHAVSAAGKYVVKGIVKFGSPELSKQLVFLPIKEAQWLFSLEERYTDIVLHLKQPKNAKNLAANLALSIGEDYEVMEWEELMPSLKNMIETDRMEGYVFMFILYMVISFGLFGTVLMMMAERQHEFGVLVAVGMKRMKLAVVVWIELLIISVLGAILGIIGAFPVCAYFYLYPIRFGEDLGKMMEDYGFEAALQTSLEPGIFIQQGIIIALMSVIIGIYPFVKLNRMDAITYMRS